MIEISESGKIRIIRLAHGKANALDLELVRELDIVLRQAGADEVGAVVLTGTGNIFCAGVHLFRVADGGAPYVKEFLPAFEKLMFTLFGFERPLIVAANGHAIAGGAVLVAAGDYRIIGNKAAKFGYTELLVGVPFPPAAMEIIRFGTPERHQQKLLFTGQTCSAEDAYRRGSADEVTEPDQLMPRALAIAEQMAELAPEGFALTKRQLRADTLRRMREQEAAQGQAVAQIWRSDAAHARIRDYLTDTVRKN
jgi:enoyl-CoA hydratase